MEKTYTISADLIKFSAALSVQTICGQINIIENDQSAAKLYYSRAQLAVEMLRFLIMEQQKRSHCSPPMSIASKQIYKTKYSVKTKHTLKHIIA